MPIKHALIRGFAKIRDMVRYRSGERLSRRKELHLAMGMALGAVIVGGVALAAPHVGIRIETGKGAKGSAGKQSVSGAATALKKPALHSGLAQSTDPSLRKLAEYEQVYGGAVADRVMVFAGLPATEADASGDAIDMSVKLKEFAKYHIKPLVVMEPTANGDPIKLTDFAAGAYDANLTQYFNNLKAQGVTDAMMGTWVHFPEDNIPEWGDTDAKLFETNVTKAARIQTQVFPDSKVSILLNSQTFRSDDVNRDYGVFSSLLPYVRDLPKGLFSSFGLQGFPWISAANQEASQLLNPTQFLNANLAREAAHALGVKNIWFNTGTFGRIYTDNPPATVNFTPSQRQAILNGVLAQLKAAQVGGFNVAVNLFSRDSSDTGEATDWSYWHTGQTTAAQAPALPVFKQFAENVHQNNMQFWVFDSSD